MRAVVQRVLSARVEVEGEVVGRIERGLVAFVGAAEGDTQADLDYTVGKVVGLRVFQDERGRMMRALAEVGGGLLVISQFTVFGDVRRGLRPSFDGAMEPVAAEALYDRFVAAARATGVTVQTGRFRADMRVHVENDGPVTILIDSRRTF
ncbi:D-aminoacyl-tRNA deacylase [Polyangium aurulentum]|uniref:D-aminoacyl-tRNA deacylase n=1 Tax=Polyangium aurulentum TaxID=2567896 RepID=UPI0010AE48AA|nr:D-aminoacyl-tRNA deacylase [Polyangium aurulentum]UQA61688.1 D-tyrosyl-tRNA(Tyr) deacylase [Polyangium aurulentum]